MIAIWESFATRKRNGLRKGTFSCKDQGNRCWRHLQRESPQLASSWSQWGLRRRIGIVFVSPWSLKCGSKWEVRELNLKARRFQERHCLLHWIKSWKPKPQVSSRPRGQQRFLRKHLRIWFTIAHRLTEFPLQGDHPLRLPAYLHQHWRYCWLLVPSHSRNMQVRLAPGARHVLCLS